MWSHAQSSHWRNNKKFTNRFPKHKTIKVIWSCTSNWNLVIEETVNWHVTYSMTSNLLETRLKTLSWAILVFGSIEAISQMLSRSWHDWCSLKSNWPKNHQKCTNKLFKYFAIFLKPCQTNKISHSKFIYFPIFFNPFSMNTYTAPKNEINEKIKFICLFSLIRLHIVSWCKNNWIFFLLLCNCECHPRMAYLCWQLCLMCWMIGTQQEKINGQKRINSNKIYLSMMNKKIMKISGNWCCWDGMKLCAFFHETQKCMAWETF